MRNAVCVVASVIVVFLLSTMLLCAFDGLPMRKAMFEVASACSTVGLTLGITGSLSTASKLLIILLMFFGRVGSLTILYAFSEAYEPPASKFPEAPVIIG